MLPMLAVSVPPVPLEVVVPPVPPFAPTLDAAKVAPLKYVSPPSVPAVPATALPTPAAPIAMTTEAPAVSVMLRALAYAPPPPPPPLLLPPPPPPPMHSTWLLAEFQSLGTVKVVPVVMRIVVAIRAPLLAAARRCL